MTTLRVRLESAWATSSSGDWALFAPDGIVLARGSTSSAGWPAHADLEFIVGAAHVRVVPLALPPLPAARVAAAAAFATEDQIAGGETDTQVGVSAQMAGGVVFATLVPRDFMRPLQQRSGPLSRLRRVIAEPELAAPEPAPTWRWCREGTASSGFVRLPDGTAFPVGGPASDGALPAELALVLRQALSAKGGTARVQVDQPAQRDDLERWQREAGVPFVPGTPWNWEDASPERFVSATNLLQGEFAPAAKVNRASARNLLAPAIVLLTVAIAFHIVATMGQWVWLKTDAWRAAGDWTSLGLAAGLPREALDSPATTRAALERRHAEMLHAHRAAAAGDALPLLARASPVFGALARGELKRAIYADGHWTLDLAVPDANLLRDLDERLRQAGLEAMIAAVPGGARVRLGAP